MRGFSFLGLARFRRCLPRCSSWPQQAFSTRKYPSEPASPSDQVAGDDRATPTGYAAYLAVGSADLMFGDPELHLFIEMLATAMWMAPGRHLGTYCIASVSRESVF